jgi:RNA polymerase sigma-70 factor (sigma-E family)
MFEDFYVDNYPWAVRLAHLLTGSSAAAEDLVQDAFANCFVRYDELTAPGAYLRQCVINASNSWHRRRGRAAAKEHLLAYNEANSPTSADVLDVLDRLPFQHKAVLILRYWLDLSEAEIAAALGCSPGTVKSWAARGLTALRKDLR